MKLSLSETLDLHKKYKPPFMPVMHGEISFKLIDSNTGQVVTAVKEKNMVTNDFQAMQVVKLSCSTLYIFISNDSTEMNVHKTCFRSTYQNTMVRSSAVSANYGAKTWSYQCTFDVPSVDRPFRTVGMSTVTEAVINTSRRVVQGVICATKLSSEYTQTTGQLLEVVYRISLSRV